jgi:hypothetical protein
MIDFSFSDDAELQKLSAQVVRPPTKFARRLRRISCALSFVFSYANVWGLGVRSRRVRALGETGTRRRSARGWSEPQLEPTSHRIDP